MNFGTPPYLECSSKGDKRFSPFYARLRSYQNQTIHHIYNSEKMYESGSTNYAVQNRNNIRPINLFELVPLFKKLWLIYFSENPELVRILLASTGISEVYTPDKYFSTSEVLWSIRTRLLQVQDIEKWIERRLL